MDSDFQEDMLMNFMAMTGCEPEMAKNLLEASGWDVGHAVELFFSTQPDADPEADAKLAQQLAREGAGGAGPGAGGAGPSAAAAFEDDEVRAPIAAKRERLIGGPDPYEGPRGMGGVGFGGPFGVAGVGIRDAIFGGAAGLHGGMYDPFVNFGEGNNARRRRLNNDPEEEDERMGAEDEDEDVGARRGRGDTRGLSSMFQPPREILTRGTFEQAKQQAQTKGTWLLVHVHDPSDFDSHRLNRDTWSHPTLKEVIQGSFVFWQAGSATPEGQRVMSNYRLDPSRQTHVIIVDPLTGQKMRAWTGFIDAERFLEDVMDFTAHGPLDEGAHGLAGQAVRREASTRANAPAPAVAAVGAGPSGAGEGEEDEELQRALAASLENGGRTDAGRFAALGGDSDEEIVMADDEEDLQLQRAIEDSRAEAASKAPPPPSAQELQAMARDRLPAEPSASEPSVRIALRLPDGRRAQRAFPPSAPLAVLRDFVASEIEEVAGGRAFSLKEPMPGAVNLDLDKAGATLEGEGMRGQMMLAVSLGVAAPVPA